MWTRLLGVLRCPNCRGSLELRALRSLDAAFSREVCELAEQRSIALDTFGEYVEAGLLLCETCRIRYPIAHGVPIMLGYVTPLHEAFDLEWKVRGAPSGFEFGSVVPALGEEFVRESFSTEWLEYDYDGVLWESTYAAHSERVCREIGPALERPADWHLEIGCGLGLATNVVQERTGCDAVGLDLSLAALKAANHFKTNPFMHFVQASAFHVPLAYDRFDLIYSRGVLHHTCSTEHAFRSVAKHCKVGGTFYVWLYSLGSIRSTPLRVGLYGLERLTRPLVSQAPDSLPARTFLMAMSIAYVGFNRLRRIANPEVQALSFGRGLHAARDRFTPRFAHRHPEDEVLRWFADAGYRSAQVLRWQDMPLAEQDDFRRNVGIRAVRET